MSQLHMTVSGTPKNTKLMENETPLLKVGLLYADKVMLSSYTSMMYIDMNSINSLNTIEKIDFLLEHMRKLYYDKEDSDKAIVKFEYYKKLFIQPKLTPKEKQDKINFQKGFRKQWLFYKDTIEKIVTENELNKLVPFIDMGLLELQSIATQDYQMDNVVQGFLNNINSILVNPNTYPLFDTTISKMVNQLQEITKLTGNSGDNHISERAKHAGFVSDVYQRLPSFEEATFDEIIDIRTELHKPLNNFRSAMLEYSQEINSVPWEEQFEYEAHKLYLMKVVPAVNEVEESCKENKMLMKVINRVVKDKFVKGASLGFGALSMTELSNILLANAGAIGYATFDGIREWKNENKNNRNMKMYYYHAISKKLK